MSEIVKGDPILLESLEKLCTGADAIRHTEDTFGNAYHWFNLDYPDLILEAARALKTAHARLAIIAAYNRQPDQPREMRNACYEFVESGVVYSVTVHMDKEHPSVPSIARIFNNADWHEREMMELYGIKITDQPNPRRLFLDEELDKGLLGDIVPLSVMMNGASSSDLWEIIMAGKGEGK